MSNNRDRALAADEVIQNALAAGLSFAEAAVLAQVSTKTIQRRLADPQFSTEVARRRALKAEEVTGLLSGIAPGAVAVIGECLANDKPVVRLRAAELALLWLTRMRREVDFEVRLARLEGTPTPTESDGDADTDREVV